MDSWSSGTQGYGGGGNNAPMAATPAGGMPQVHTHHLGIGWSTVEVGAKVAHGHCARVLCKL